MLKHTGMVKSNLVYLQYMNEWMNMISMLSTKQRRVIICTLFLNATITIALAIVAFTVYVSTKTETSIEDRMSS